MNRVGFLWLVIFGMYASWSPPDVSAPAPKRRILVLAGSLQKRFIDMLFRSCQEVSLWDSPSLFFSLLAIARSLLAPLLPSNFYLLRACLFWMQGLCQEVKKESTGKKKWSSCRKGRTRLLSLYPSGKTRGKKEEPKDNAQLCHLCHPHCEIQTHKPENKMKACFVTWEKILSKPQWGISDYLLIHS